MVAALLVGGALVLAAMYLSELAPGRTTTAAPPVPAEDAEDADVPAGDVGPRTTGAVSGGP